MPRETGNYVSYADVMRALQDVANTWDIRLQIVMSLPAQPVKGIDCNVRLAALRKDAQGRWNDVGGLSTYWPNPDSSTMTGAILKLIYDYDSACQRDDETDQMARSAVRQSRFF